MDLIVTGLFVAFFYVCDESLGTLPYIQENVLVMSETCKMCEATTAMSVETAFSSDILTTDLFFHVS